MYPCLPFEHFANRSSRKRGRGSNACPCESSLVGDQAIPGALLSMGTVPKGRSWRWLSCERLRLPTITKGRTGVPRVHRDYSPLLQRWLMYSSSHLGRLLHVQLSVKPFFHSRYGQRLSSTCNKKLSTVS